jgi:hypothetical protein
MWLIYLSIVAMETQQWVPLLRLSVTTNNVTSTKNLQWKRVNYIFVPDFNQIWILLTDFHEVPNNRYHRNPFNRNRTDTMGQAVVRP